MLVRAELATVVKVLEVAIATGRMASKVICLTNTLRAVAGLSCSSGSIAIKAGGSAPLWRNPRTPALLALEKALTAVDPIMKQSNDEQWSADTPLKQAAASMTQWWGVT